MITKTFTRLIPPIKAIEGLEVGISAAATVFAAKLQEDLQPGTRQGQDWTGSPWENPRVSSAPGEPEQYQQGDLANSVDVRPGTQGALGLFFPWEFGFFDQPMDKLTELEIDQENKRYRGWLTVVATEQPETQEAATRLLVEAMNFQGGQG